MKTLHQVKSEYIAEAQANPVSAFGFIDRQGNIQSMSSRPVFFIQQAKSDITVKVDKKHLNGDFVAEEVALDWQYGGDLPDFEGHQLYSFTTPARGKDNLKAEVLDRPLLGKATVRFPKGQNIAVLTQRITEPLLRSTIDGRYYLLEQLPEQDDARVTAHYAETVKAERNARLSDTDAYSQLPDITVKVAEDAGRRALTEAERAEVLAYRTALRDMPEAEGFPFIEYPQIPQCIQIECQAKIEQRQTMEGF